MSNTLESEAKEHPVIPELQGVINQGHPYFIRGNKIFDGTNPKGEPVADVRQFGINIQTVLEAPGYNITHSPHPDLERLQRYAGRPDRPPMI